MKKVAILFFSLFFITQIFSQNKAIKITNTSSKKEKEIKENKRVKIKTINGQEISGRFKVKNDNTIVIKNNLIRLHNILEIKRDSLFIAILTSTFFVYLGTGFAIYALFSGLLVNPSALLLAMLAAALIYISMDSPNLQKKYKNDSNWTFSTTTIYK
ncbi:MULTISPECIES: hypothetical protein [unclassified Polaribacter]|uniref:hypothetical protein n=1 Tax=unclassified Polaribacter TaxID=196858 RepID=UPI0011BF2866|nr:MULTISPECIES: hypothetical protein [unclassified Polaribacter]TXD51640.1 hypothetical protein ES043_11130 [Polaribacter sp. IC063]TXD58800.1 hypothetical protein ES044_11440 [Polaribacter sp. IC066]